MQIRKWSPLGGRTLLVLALGLGIGSVVLASEDPGENPGKTEVGDPGKSWPHEVRSPAHSDKSAATLLTEIQDKALAALEGADAESRQPMLSAIRKVSICLAYDGHVPVGDPPESPPPAHHASYAGAGSHASALAKVCAAYSAVFPEPPEEPDWAVAAQHLEHGH